MRQTLTGFITHPIYFIFILSFIFSPRLGNAFQRNIVLDEGWYIRSSADVEASGEAISSPDFDLDGWYPATVPTTVLATLVKNNIYQDPYVGKNLENIPKEQFEKSWWYRKKFDLPENDSFNYVRLEFNGINYKANIWLNGKQIASSDSVTGAFRRFEFDISEFVQSGKNILAVEVFPPKPGDFSVGFVDWNPVPPDNSMGIWRDVNVHLNGSVSINNTFIQSKVNLETLADATLTITTDLVNHSDQPVSGILQGIIETIRFSQKISLKSHERKTVQFNANQYKELDIQNARLWWPNNLGPQNLYNLKLSFLINGKVSDEQTTSFGIRDVSDYINEEGYRGYKINGKKILIRGAGWTDDLMLADDSRTLEAKVKYAKQMNLNTIRMEGFWGNSEKLYELCDRFGLLVMVGWSAQWEWEGRLGKPVDEFGGIKTPEEMELVARYLRDQIVWLRNHPSIFLWMLGSDKLPRPELEKKYLKVLREYDTSRPYLASAAYRKSELTGITAVKMNGPYDYVPPVYWYVDRSNGGAFGFNTETGPGAQPPPLESLKKMIPGDHLWPIDDYWMYHFLARKDFNTLDVYEKALNNRYGKAYNVQEFTRKAQVMNYEAIRAMFEAFAANKYISTGIIQWMLNSAWPKMFWQLYDYYLAPNGAFYGAKKANEPIHILYNYGDNSIYVINDTYSTLHDFKAEIRILDINSKERFKKTETIHVEENKSAQLFQLPEIAGLSVTYFVDLRLADSVGRQVSNNFYWLSTKREVLDEGGTTWYYTPIKEYADFTALMDLPQVKINVQHRIEKKGDKQMVYVVVENPTDAIAFFVYLDIVAKQSGDPVLPIFWDDNYITLLPGESKEINVYFSSEDLKGDQPVLKVSGWNLITE
jgi:exo-1,4-beta-D-glucosaminidase